MTDTKNALDVVAGLMRERQKYEGWIESLEARRADAPVHVFERVHADYEHRLLEVIRQLGEHSPVLEEQARTLESRMSRLADDERAQRDLRAEAELRSHVGELSAEDWQTLASESDTALATLAEEQERVRVELSQVRELLTAATTPPRALTPVAVEAVPAAESAEAPAAESTPSVAEAPPGDREPVAAAESGGPADGLVSVESLSTPDARTPAETQQFDELEFLKSVADAVTPGAGLAVGAAQIADLAPRALDAAPVVAAHEAPAAHAGVRRVGVPGSAPMAANVTGNQPIILRSETSQTKTLKCSDCGAMNFPTEWYCERCGAELAAL